MHGRTSVVRSAGYILNFAFAAVATVFVFGFWVPSRAFAASLYISPSAKTLTVGQTFTVTVGVSSPDQAMNAASGDISFPSGVLHAESVSKAGSVMSLWVQDPTVSNAGSSGDVNFSGVVLNPGFTGNAGKLVAITFRAVAPGSANLSFADGSVLANDGNGTNILTSMPGASFTVVSGAAVPAPVNQNLPPAPIIASNTHPDGTRWYNGKTLQLSWSLPSGITGVSYALYSTSNFVLPSVSKGLPSGISYDLTTYREGTWYFYAKFQNANGWGPTTMRTVNIDMSPPESFAVNEVGGGDATDPQPIFTWRAADVVSGVAKYLVKIDDGDWFDAATIATSSASNEYQLPLQAPGNDIPFAVEAYDAAGNMTEATTTFSVAPLPPVAILSYPAKLGSTNQLLSVRGSVVRGNDSRPMTVRLQLQKSGVIMTFSAPVDQGGNWDFAQGVNLAGGSWALTARTTDDRGAVGATTAPVAIAVGGWVDEVVSYFVSWSAVVLAGIICFAIILAIIFGLIHVVKRWRLTLSRRFVKEKKELRDDLVRIEKELDADRDARAADMGPAEIRKRHGVIRREIEHLEKDIEKDMRETDED